MSLFQALLHVLQQTFRLANRIHGEIHCNDPLLELYLPSLGKVQMRTQYPRIAQGLFGGAAMKRRRLLQ